MLIRTLFVIDEIVEAFPSPVILTLFVKVNGDAIL